MAKTPERIRLLAPRSTSDALRRAVNHNRPQRFDAGCLFWTVTLADGRKVEIQLVPDDGAAPFVQAVS